MDSQRPPATFSFEEPPHLTIIETSFYPEVTALQRQGALAVLDRVKATYELLTVPGALEIPAAISFSIRALDFDPVRRRSDGFIALGCVIKGGTHHDEIVSFESARALQDLAVRYALAIGNGILTCNTLEQAMERADPARLDRCGAAAEACLRMVELKHKFHLMPKRRWIAKK
ncbi:MAG: 6,7-dimethyl-8-ribityllumazine synthase [Bdellovibrionales bacterium]|jgi:6,7-dimethyl-8-ribityllumazine synthase